VGLRYYYRPSWRPLATDPAVEFTDNVRLYTLDCTEQAEESSPGFFSIPVDDPDGVLDFPPLTRIWAVESDIAASSNTYVFHGYIDQRTVRRGDSTRTSSGRVWQINVVDENSVAARRVLSNPNANRPAETDVARVQWLANEADGQLLIDDTTFLSTASPVSMDAADYRGQTGSDVLNDCAQASGKNHWFWFNQAVGTGLWYGAEDLTTYSSMIRLTNVLGDVDNVFTFAISEDTTLERSPDRMLSGVYYQYAEDAVYVRNTAMFPEIGMRDLPYSSTNVKTSTKATARANRYLADNDSEDDRITTTVLLPAAKVNWIRAGMRVRFRAQHLPGYESEVWLRVYRRSVVHISEETAINYAVTLELGTGSIPASPADVPAEPPGESILTAALSVGDPAHGISPSREQHFATQVGTGTIALTPGKQYRLKMTVTANANVPTYGNDHLATLGAKINIAAADPTVAGSSYGWSPTIAPTDLLEYPDGGPSWTVKDPVRDGGSAPNNSYAAGSVITGDWTGFLGSIPLTAGDVSLQGSPLSGFFGFQLSALVELQERDAP
jgi:hypothetical protein